MISRIMYDSIHNLYYSSSIIFDMEAEPASALIAEAEQYNRIIDIHSPSQRHLYYEKRIQVNLGGVNLIEIV